MNDRYLFRAKRKDNGKCVEGYYVCLNENQHRIYTGYAETDCGEYFPDCHEVVAETVEKCSEVQGDQKYITALEKSVAARESERVGLLQKLQQAQAEIEELESQMEFLTGYNGNLIDANVALTGAIEICKSEAIKEFAERLKRVISDERFSRYGIEHDIDRVANEMRKTL